MSLDSGAAKTLDLYVILISAACCIAERCGPWISAAMSLYIYMLSCFDVCPDCSSSCLPNNIFTGTKWPRKPFAWPHNVLTCRDESGASWLIFSSIDEIIDVAYWNPDPKIWKEVKCHFILTLGYSIGFTLHGVWQAPIMGWALVVLDPAPVPKTARTDFLFLHACIVQVCGTERRVLQALPSKWLGTVA